MGSKLLFVLGIVLAHSAVAAGLMSEDGSRPRTPIVTTCVKAPTTPRFITPPRELLAYVVPARDNGISQQ